MSSTWSTTAPIPQAALASGVHISIVNTCTTGSETLASGASATYGMALGGLHAFDVVVQATSSTFSAGTLSAYLYDPVNSIWARVPDLDLVVTAGLTAQAYPSQLVTSREGRVAYMPTGLGVACVITLEGVMVRNGA